MKRVVWMCALLILIGGCAALQKAGVTTYTVEAEKLTAAREALGIPPCPDGEAAQALVVKLESGGATIAVRCGSVP